MPLALVAGVLFALAALAAGNFASVLLQSLGVALGGFLAMFGLGLPAKAVPAPPATDVAGPAPPESPS